MTAPLPRHRAPSTPVIDWTGVWLHDQVQKQAWYRENANTVTGIVGLAVTISTWAAASPLGADPRVQMAILIVGFVGTVFGVNQTHNGWSKSQVRKINEARADVIDELHEPEHHAEKSPVSELVDNAVEATNAHEKMVTEFNKRREV